MELQGKIKTIGAIETKGTNNFKTRKIMLDRSSTYEGKTRTNFTEISLLGDKTDLPEQKGLQAGDFVKCQFNIEGRFFTHEGTEKFAQDVKVWQIDVVSKAQPATTSAQQEAKGNTAPY